MSFDRNDLLSVSAGATLEPGFYGMSDPLNLRSSMERFECDFAYGANTQMYKLRLLNPTTELEYQFAQFFQQIYPTSHGVVNDWASVAKRQETLESVTGEVDDYYLATGQGSRNTVPTVYLRWGYGTEENNGISQIHKCRVSDVRYQINANKDKVVELMLVDLFTFTRTSNIYNKREHIATIPWKSPEFPEGKKVSQMLSEVLGGFAANYPELIVVSELRNPSNADNSFGSKLDSTVEGIAKQLAKDAQQKLEEQFNAARQALLDSGLAQGGVLPSVAEPSSRTRGADDKVSVQGDSNPGRDREGWAEVLEKIESDPEKKKQFEDKLNVPIATIKKWAKEREKTGVVGDAQLLQAYKIFFNQIGLQWEINESGSLEVFTNGVPAANQIDTGIVPTQNDIDRAVNNADEELLINLFDYTDIYKPKFSASERERLSFWPPILDLVEAPEIVSEPIAKVTNIDINGSGTAISKYTFGTEAYGSNGTEDIPDAIVVTFDEVMLDGIVQYGGTDLGSLPPDIFYSGIGAVKFFDINGTVVLNSEADTGAEGTDYYLFNPNTSTSGNPNNTAFLLRDLPVDYESAVASILKSSDFPLIEPFEPSPEAAAYPPTAVQKSPPSDGPRQLRPMTAQEKVDARAAGTAPLFLEPGPVNTVNNRYDGPARRPNQNQLKDYAQWTEDYVFSYADLTRMFPHKTFERNENTYSLPPILCEVRTPYQFSMRKYDSDDITNSRQSPFYMPARVLNFESMGASYHKGGALGDGTVLKKFIPPPPDASYHPDKYPIINKENMELLTFDDSYLMEGTGYVDPNTGEPRPGPGLPGGPQNIEVPLNENEFTSWRATYCPEWEKHVTEDNRALFPEQWNYGNGYPDDVSPGSLQNWQRISNQKLYLEPTVETWKYLSQMAVDIFTDLRRLPMGPPQLLTPPPEAPKPKEVKATKPPDYQGYLSLGTEGDAPNITISLEKVVNALNSFLIDSAAKIQINVLDLGRLTKQQSDDFILDTKGYLPGFNKSDREDMVKQSKTVMFVATDDTINNWTTANVNPVNSFPEITVDGIGKENIIYLDYATKDSIVTDLKFEGEYRWLLGISQAVFMNRYFGSINEYFDKETLQGRLVNRYLGQELQARIDRLREHPDDVATEGGYTLAESQALLDKYNSRPNQIDSYLYIDSDILALLPGLVSYYNFSDLRERVGDQNAKDLTIISCLVNDPYTLELLFPEMEFQAGTNEQESTLAVQGAKKSWVAPILTRRVDFQTTYMRLGEDNQRELQRKMMDTNFFFTQAMQQTAWEVELETLGIPELDNPIVEFAQRYVGLRVYDARLSTNTLHWLSGWYRILGINHTIDSSEGYKTKLRLYRVDTDLDVNLAGGLEVPNA